MLSVYALGQCIVLWMNSGLNLCIMIFIPCYVQMADMTARVRTCNAPYIPKARV